MSSERTESSPIFQKSAEDLASRLADETTQVGRAMALEARTLVQTFRSWGENRPTDEVRIGAIRALFELNRRAMDYLSTKSAAPVSSKR